MDSRWREEQAWSWVTNTCQALSESLCSHASFPCSSPGVTVRELCGIFTNAQSGDPTVNTVTYTNTGAVALGPAVTRRKRALLRPLSSWALKHQGHWDGLPAGSCPRPEHRAKEPCVGSELHLPQEGLEPSIQASLWLPTSPDEHNASLCLNSREREVTHHFGRSSRSWDVPLPCSELL